MEEYCGYCAWLDEKNKERYSSLDRYYCDKRGGYHELTEKGCYSFMKDPEKGKKEGGYQPSGCYITTIVCEILGYDDDCELLTILRNFRDTYLKNNIEYLPILLEYDAIGPIISDNIAKRRDAYRLCLNILSNFLIPCAKDIQNGQYATAIEIYKNMVLKLKEDFTIEGISINENYDINTVGKGRFR